jgi:hypothetical protein
MPVTVLLPDFNESREVILSKWLKSVGDRVEVGENIVELEKVRVPYLLRSGRPMPSRPSHYLAAYHYGTLTEIFVAEGQRVESGQAIASLSPWPCPTPTSTTLVEMRNILKDSPPERKVGVPEVFHFVGWLVTIIWLWRIALPIEEFVVNNSPLWLRWLIDLPLAVVVFGLTAFLLIYGIEQLMKPRSFIGKRETKAWLQTHWSNLAANCKIMDREDGPPGTRLDLQ